MLRVSKLTDYATAVMACLVETGDGIASAQALAGRARLAVPTVSKVLKQLAQAGLVSSERGIHGGYRLARPAAQITVADIVVAMEGPIGLTECSARAGACGHEPHCGVRVNWQHISQAVVAALEGVTLADMVRAPVAYHAAKIPLRTSPA